MTDAPFVASVVIPAHNEENVIGACLERLLADAQPGEFDVVVVANACTDRTAEIAAAAHPDVRVVETEIGSKPLAMDLGDGVARGFPRIYLDADVEVTTAAIRATAAVLRSGTVHAAAPRIRVDVAGRPWRVRAYYEIWTQMPYVSEAHVGSGVYGMSEEGRGRFAEFPRLLSEDLFIRDLFTPAERRTVDEFEFVDRAPLTLSAILKIKGRAAAGNRQYAQKFPELAAQARASEGSARAVATRIARQPRQWPALALYCSVYAASQARGWWKFRYGDLDKWDRDESARSMPVTP